MNLGIGLGVTNYLRVPTVPLDPEIAIAALFESGEEGAWYDPSDLTTLYQDAAGTTPVTGTGQPVGLMLDKSKGLTLGSELVTNGTFDTDVSGWTAQTVGTTITFVSGTAACVTPSAGGMYQSFATTAGKWYEASAITVSSTGQHRIRAVNGTAAAGTTLAETADSTGPSSFTLRFLATGSSSTIYCRHNAGSTQQWDNISVRELPGNHATQSTSTARPTLQLSGSSYYLDFDGVDDRMGPVTFASAQAQPNTIAAAIKDDSTATMYAWDGISQRQGLLHLLSHIYILASATSLQAADARDNLDYVATAYYNTTSSEIRKNGASVATGNVGTNTWDGVNLGSNSLGGSSWNGRIYGFIGVNRTLTAGEIDDVEAYLAAKSGVTL